MSSLFGSNTATQNQPAGGGLFGSSTTQNQNTGSSLFGNTGNQQPNQGTSLFGSNANTQNQPATGGGVFGSSTTNQQPQGGSSLFGGNAATQTQQQSTSLFGGNTATQNQPTNTGTGLFGSSTTNAQPQQQSTGLFGASTTTNTQTQPANTTSNTSLFNQPASIPPLYQSTTFAPSRSQNTQPQQTHLSTLMQSGLGNSTPNYGALGSASQHDLARSRLTEAGLNARPNEKSVFSQVQTLVRKWDPNSTDTLMQTYLYNAVNSTYAPFYYRNADEEESKWEEALAKKPANVENDGVSVSFVPVLVRGFHALGQRVEYQAKIVTEMRTRLHEMNNSLDAVMATHSQSLSVRLENARRQHAALSQRCLRLAVKAQILRHRNYPLDAAEEGLRRTLLDLEKKVFDPQFSAREEEIWARMVALRERGRWLEEEGKRVRSEVEGQQGGNGKEGGGGVSEEVLAKTRRILRDYDGQISLLGRELEDVRREFEEWEGSSRPSAR